MLLHLSLKDFVIVKELSLDLSTGLTVLTGETGAGKSILIDALQLILLSVKEQNKPTLRPFLKSMMRYLPSFVIPH